MALPGDNLVVDMKLDVPLAIVQGILPKKRFKIIFFF